MEPRGRQQPKAGREITRKIPEARVRRSPVRQRHGDASHFVLANPCFRAIQSVCKCPRDEGPSALDDLARRVHFEGEQRQRVLHLRRLILLRGSTGHVNKGYTVQSFCCVVAVSSRAPRRRCRCLAVVVPQA